MPTRGSGNGWRGLWAACAAAAIVSLSAAGVQAQSYILDDAKISGTEVYSFTDGAERVTLVSGSFLLEAGKRRVSSRDAVLWIRTSSDGRSQRHDITIYAEGSAKVQEGGGTTTSDRMMLVEVHVQGRLRLSPVPLEKSLTDFPLYERAKEARAQNRGALATTRPAAHEAPVLIIVRPEGGAAQKPGPEAPSTPPALAKAPKVKPVLPVSLDADKQIYQKTERGSFIMATGNVQLLQGAPTGKAVLELRCQAAVVFLEPQPPKEAGGSLLGGKTAASLPSLTGDSNAPRETITGVYLLDDVVISLGERVMRGPEAYYDFTTDRAIVREPVFRMIEERRAIPLYVRAQEGRMLSDRELWFKDAEISTSDFYTPTYFVHADKAYLMNETHYDDQGVRVGPQHWRDELTNIVVEDRNVPIFYWPYSEGDVTEEHMALRRVQVGSQKGFGTGVETDWYLFRVLGLVAPEGFTGKAELDAYSEGTEVGADMKYARQSYSGYSKLYGIDDRKQLDRFGRENFDVPAPPFRGWLLERHKQLVDDWEVQFEVSWLTDKNFLERFFPDEYFGGKEQETLIYAKKQEDNWAFTSLLKTRINDFQTQSDAYPDLSLYLLGEPVGDQLTWYSENHGGLRRFQEADGDANEQSSDVLARGDTRQEVDFPLHLGPVNIVPYATGRASGWSDAPPGGDEFRPYGQMGVKMDTHIWRQDQDVESRLWDLHGLRHVITPEAQAYLSTTGGVESDDLFPIDPGIEENITQMQAWAVGVSQRLQTRRGVPGQEKTVDWMRLNVQAGAFYDTPNDQLFPGDGRSFFSRPEYSLPRNHISANYQWQISDSTLFLSDVNYDLPNASIDQYSFGLCVQRDPRMEYFFGVRSMSELDSTVGTAGVNYQLTEKYRVSVFEQYDFDFDNGTNYSTAMTLARKIERWYGAVTVSYNQTDNDIAVFLTFWPEGAPGMRFGSPRLNLLGSSSSN